MAWCQTGGKATALFRHCVLLCSLLPPSEQCLCFSIPEDSQLSSVLSGLITPSSAVSRRRLAADSLPLGYWRLPVPPRAPTLELRRTLNCKWFLMCQSVSSRSLNASHSAECSVERYKCAESSDHVYILWRCAEDLYWLVAICDQSNKHVMMPNTTTTATMFPFFEQRELT